MRFTFKGQGINPIKQGGEKMTRVTRRQRSAPNTLSYIVFRMAQSEPSSGVKGKVIYNKNLSN